VWNADDWPVIEQVHELPPEVRRAFVDHWRVGLDVLAGMKVEADCLRRDLEIVSAEMAPSGDGRRAIWYRVVVRNRGERFAYSALRFRASYSGGGTIETRGVVEPGKSLTYVNLPGGALPPAGERPTLQIVGALPSRVSTPPVAESKGKK